MAGISAIATSIPRYRLPREVIARAWAGVSMGGERTVANHDEDRVTLAVDAAPGLGSAVDDVGAVYLATTSSPYAEKQGAATLAAVLGVPTAARYVQLTDCATDALAIEIPLELTFRRLHDAGGFHNYFWKARPV
jgi:hydroxymethylglutaryl-CoA synthase